MFIQTKVLPLIWTNLQVLTPCALKKSSGAQNCWHKDIFVAFIPISILWNYFLYFSDLHRTHIEMLLNRLALACIPKRLWVWEWHTVRFESEEDTTFSYAHSNISAIRICILLELRKLNNILTLYASRLVRTLM